MGSQWKTERASRRRLRTAESTYYIQSVGQACTNSISLSACEFASDRSEIMPKRRAPAAAPAAAMALVAHAAASASMAPSAGSADSNAQPVDVAADAAQAPPGPSPLEVEEQPLEKLPDGKAYDSCDEDDGPSCILEDESLVALAGDKEEVVESAATGTASGSSAKQPAKVSGGSPSKSPTRARTIITGVANALKKLTAKEQKKEVFNTASAFFLSCSDWCSALHRTTKSGCG